MLKQLLCRVSVYLTLLAAALLAGGCGDKSDDLDLVLAEVGDRQITVKYFRDRVARLAQEDPSRDRRQLAMDMSSHEGRRALLDEIIDRNVMIAKALQVGYLEDPVLQAAQNQMIRAQAVEFFWKDRSITPGDVTQEQIDHYLSRLGELRRCHYVITATEADGWAARQAFLDGAQWSQVAARYHHLPYNKYGLLEEFYPWGMVLEDVQGPLFALEIGGVTEPIGAENGWWVLQLKGIVQKPPVDLDPNQVRIAIVLRENQSRHKRVLSELKRERNYMLDLEALRILVDGLPEDEASFDPETKEPIPVDLLQPLRIPTTEFERVLSSYDLIDRREEMTLVDYKAFFDRQNAFQRLRKSEGLVAIRNKLDAAIVDLLVADEVQRFGYLEDPRVQEEAFALLEPLIVDRVQQELVRYDENVPPDVLRAYYAEHEDSYWRSEHRKGTLIRFGGQSEAITARESWINGVLAPNIERIAVGPLVDNPDRPMNRIIFGLDPGAISEVFETPDGWAVVRLDSILAREKIDFLTAAPNVAHRIRAERREQALRRLLDRWSEEFGVTVHENRMARVSGW